jgi:hypothetical protein
MSGGVTNNQTFAALAGAVGAVLLSWLFGVNYNSDKCLVSKDNVETLNTAYTNLNSNWQKMFDQQELMFTDSQNSMLHQKDRDGISIGKSDAMNLADISVAKLLSSCGLNNAPR